MYSINTVDSFIVKWKHQLIGESRNTIYRPFCDTKVIQKSYNDVKIKT